MMTNAPTRHLLTAQGDTTVYGRLIRIGGTGPRATLQMPDGKSLHVELSESMAVELASRGRLQEDVGIEGRATWRVDTWEILEFRARHITAYQPDKTNHVETFEALAEAAGDRWEGVDVERFDAGLRGDARDS
jgi:hypothetical protein